ncbi:MAG: exodeoxyribonuclease V subunit gamma [Desulfobacterota bacterium]|jgi:exodeoxyribonuclease V gamma subunit|nr:exodeoxyribonuclease V subunit gamma [Thermodesulfobacteriota bacterium]
MGNLRVFTSNRLEILADELGRVLQSTPPSPFDPEIIVVQSKGMERWICLQLAERQGVCANCRFPFPNTFIQEIVQSYLKKLPKPDLFDPGIMTWRVMKALSKLIEEPAFEPLRIYLESGRSDLKRFQLSQRIADLFDQYLLFRPKMMFQWEKGKARHWQAVLWRELVRGHEREHRAALGKELFTAIEQGTEQPAGIPGRISVFGISALPRFHVQVFASLSQISQVTLFLMNPSREYWGDILDTWEMKKKARKVEAVSEGELHMEKGNSLLASMGRLGRDFFEMIQEFDAEEFSTYEEPNEEGLLSCVQLDILKLQEREGKKAVSPHDLSIQIHSCHSPMREAEVLRDRLLRMFEEDPGLLPKDILVMMPDVETYAPYIQGVFDTASEDPRRIPFSIADRSMRKEGGIGEAFLNLLDLQGSRFGVSQVVNLLECEAVRRKFGLSNEDLEAVRKWISETRIRWGIDESHKAGLGLPSFPQNTWRAGLDRLLLGFAMPGREERLFSGILPYDPIEGEETRILGAFAEFVEKLFERATALGEPKTLESWHEELAALLDDFFEPGEETDREMHLIRRMLDDLVKTGAASLFDEKIPLQVVRCHLERTLDQTGFGLGFMTGGVTFCAMLPMRSIPFKVICLLGMDGEAYPRPSYPLGFDYMSRYPKRGDRSRRNDDRYLFLEAILSARERLYISYVGQSIQDNSMIPPSVLVSELVDYVEQGFEISDRNLRDHLETKHRLQAFSPEYFKNQEKLFTYSEESYEIAATVLAERKGRTPFLTEGLSEPDDSWKELDLHSLCAFFSDPVRFLLNRRLGVYLEEKSSFAEQREPFEVQSLEQYLLEESMLRRYLQGRSLKDDFSLAVASGRLPHGPVGQCVYETFSPGVERFAKHLLSLTGAEAAETRDFRIEVGDFSLSGSLDRVFKDAMIRYRYARLKGKDLMVSWIHHLVLNCAGAGGFPRRTLLAGLAGKSAKDRKRVLYECAPVEKAEELLENLLKRYWEGLRAPLPFFPEISWAYAETCLTKNKPREAALDQARRTWEGTEWSRGESEDAYHQLCFGNEDPIGSAFEEAAMEVFGPLLKHLREAEKGKQ